MYLCRKKFNLFKMKKLALILSCATLLISCNVEPLETSQNESNASSNGNQGNQISIDPDNTSTTTTTVLPDFMDANVNGVQFSNLRPMNYVDSSSNQSKVEVYTSSTLLTHNYLFLQGSNVTQGGTANADSILINLRIPQSQWVIGTYELQDAKTVVMNGNNSSVEIFDIGRGVKTQAIQGGIITITEFNMVTRRVKGFFSFTYTTVNNLVVEGPFAVSGGTFNYKLDGAYFL